MNLQDITPEVIHNAFARHCDDVDRNLRYEHDLFRHMTKEDWVNCYKERSRSIRDAFEHSNEFSSIVQNYYEHKYELTPENAEAFYDEIINLDLGRYDEPFLGIKCLRILIDYYFPSGDLVHLLPLYNLQGWEATTTIRMGYEENCHLALDSYKFILSHKDKYASFDDPAIRRLFFVAFYNIICVFASLAKPLMTLNETVPYLREVMNFYHSETVQSIDGDNEAIRKLFHYTQSQWLSLDNLLADSSHETADYYCDLAEKVYAKQLEQDGDIYSVSAEVILAYQKAQLLRGNISYRNSINYLLDYYDERRRLNSGLIIPENFTIDSNFYFESRIPSFILKLIDEDANCTYSVKAEIRDRVIAGKNDFFARLSHSVNSYSAFINTSISEWCFESLRYLDSVEEKEEAIFSNIINRQIATFFHSHMVRIIAGMFTDSLLVNRPELLLPVIEAKNVEDIKGLEDGIRDYVHKAALLHDIGKNLITDVINMQTRRLTDEEFAVIRKHPRIGAEAVDEDFMLYHDVILGHHRSYDCRSGYPMDFDPSRSNVKIIIDMIAICDSLDAATDYLGRNYAIRKDLSTVLKELRDGAGTRYNPDLVALLDTDKELFTKLNELIDHGREDIYYNLFKEHFMNKN